MTDRTPYTYLIGWSTLETYYYGVKYAKGCHPSMLWKTYFTSSSKVHEFRNEHGEPDVVEVRKIFEHVDEAIAWEKKVLSRMKVLQSQKWLNQNIGGAMTPWIGEMNPMYGRSRTGEIHNNGEAISLALKEWYKTEAGNEKKLAMSAAMKGNLNPMRGNQHTNEYKEMMSTKMSGEGNPMYGVAHTAEARAKISAARRGRPSPTKGKPSSQKGVPKGPMPSEVKQKLRKTYVVNGTEIVQNAKEYCALHDLNYTKFTSAAKNNTIYKGLDIKYQVC